MDGQPDILSFEPRRVGVRRPGRGWIAIVALVTLLAVIVYLVLLVVHQDGTISDLHAALRNAHVPAPATTAEPTPAVEGSSMVTLPSPAGGSFSVVVITVSPRPNSAPLTWLFIYGRHADPGQRYGLLTDTCRGQYVSSSDLADATADRRGDLTIVTPGLAISPASGDVWFMLYRWKDGAPLGGIQGPLIGTSARTFRTAPRC